MSGWIKVHRALLKHPTFRGRADWMGAFIWMLMRARWKDSTYSLGGKTVDLKRGQLVISLGSMEAEWGMTKKKIRGFMARLEMDTVVVTAKGTAGTIVTICNYDEYQGEDESEGTPEGTGEGTPRAHRGHTTEEREERKKDSEGADAPSKQRKAGRLPSNWQLPNSWGQWAVSQGLSAEKVRLEAEKFRDYWIAKSGKDATKTNWEATWRNWIRNVLERSGSVQSLKPRSTILDQIEREEAAKARERVG